MDVGRNDPCPCGSGQKYKKCCLKEKVAGAEARYAEQASAEPAYDVGDRRFDMSAYAVSQMMERDHVLARQDRKSREILKNKWTPKKVRPLETEEIVERLRKLGIETSRDAYRVLTPGRISAWSISEVWVADLRGKGVALSNDDDDFTGQAACELWRRFVPERASVEMADDWMQEGYDLQHSDDEKTCDVWGEVWDYFKSTLCCVSRPMA